MLCCVAVQAVEAAEHGLVLWPFAEPRLAVPCLLLPQEITAKLVADPNTQRWVASKGVHAYLRELNLVALSRVTCTRQTGIPLP